MRGENRSTRRKTFRSRVENQQTQPTYDAEPGYRTRATLVGGECSDTTPTLFPKCRTLFFFLIVSEKGTESFPNFDHL